MNRQAKCIVLSVWCVILVISEVHAEYSHCEGSGYSDNGQELVIGYLLSCQADLTEDSTLSRTTTTVGQSAQGTLRLSAEFFLPSIYTDELVIAAASGSSGSSVTLTNDTTNRETLIKADRVVVGGSALGYLTIGDYCAVKIKTPGTLTAEFLIGNGVNSNGNVTVSGGEGIITLYRNFKVGVSGRGTLFIGGGAFVSGNFLRLGAFGGSQGTLILDGVNPDDPSEPSRFFANPTTYIGDRGSGELIVRNGAHYEAFFAPGSTSGGNVYVGSTGPRSSISVTDEGSRLTCRTLYASHADIDISDGGLIDSYDLVSLGANGYPTRLTIAGGRLVTAEMWIRSDGAEDSLALVTGEDSILEVIGTIDIANPYEASRNALGRLVIEDGAIANAAAVNIGTVPNAGQTHGYLEISSGATLTVAAVTIGCDGTLSGDGGTIVGDVEHTCGDFEPGQSPGEFFIQGNYNQGVDGTLLLEVGGTVAGEFDSVVVDGTATLAGTIEVFFVSGFLPSPAHQFVLLQAGEGLDLSEADIVFPDVAPEIGVTFDAATGGFIFDVPVVTGDVNNDGLVDLADYSSFEDCLAGPAMSPDPIGVLTSEECMATYDFDLDGDIDGKDFAALQVLFGEL